MKIKYHIFASLFFLILIVGAVVISQVLSGGGGATEQQSERFVQIVNATWGENCTSQIRAMIRTQQKDDNGEIPTLPRENNALMSLSKLCNGLESCAVSVNPDSLGAPPVLSCHKEIDVEYRCFMTDRAHKIHAQDDDTLNIDCTEKAS